MTKLELLIFAAGPCIWVVWGFAQWERDGKAVRAVVLLLVLELIEAALYENESFVPRGLFHPGSGSTQLQLPEIFITLALIGRLVAKRLPKRIGVPAMIWAAFGAWLVVEVVEGYLQQNVHSQILYEAKALIYVVGGFALAAGVPVRRYIEAQVFERIARWFAPLVLVLDFFGTAHTTFSLNLPLVPLAGFGVVGSDAGTMFGAVGLVALLLELGKSRRNAWTLVCTVPLLLSAVIAGQRAALIGLGASAAVVFLTTLGSAARRRLHVHFAELLLAVIFVIGVAVVVIFAPAALNQGSPKIPFSSTISTELNSRGKIESAQDRRNEFAAASVIIDNHWILGTGLGIEYTYWAPGPNLEITSALTEDIYTDLWVRTGIIGLALFVVAVLISFGDGMWVWRRHPDHMVAIFAIGLVAVILGLLIKGGFESDFENYGLATFLGLLLGMLRSAVTSADNKLASQPATLAVEVNERA